MKSSWAPSVISKSEALVTLALTAGVAGFAVAAMRSSAAVTEHAGA